MFMLCMVPGWSHSSSEQDKSSLCNKWKIEDSCRSHGIIQSHLLELKSSDHMSKIFLEASENIPVWNLYDEIVMTSFHGFLVETLKISLGSNLMLKIG